MVGEDDHKSLEEQQAKEQEEDEELRRQLEDMDTTWETKKSREQELKDRKRRRLKDSVEDAPEDEGGRKRRRKMKYDVLGEDLGQGVGADELGGYVDGEDSSDSHEVVMSAPPPPVHRGSIENRRPSISSKNSLITDYFMSINQQPRVGWLRECAYLGWIVRMVMRRGH